MSCRWTTAPRQSYTLLGRLGLAGGTLLLEELQLLVTSHDSPDLGLELDMVKILTEYLGLNSYHLFVCTFFISEIFLVEKQTETYLKSRLLRK